MSLVNYKYLTLLFVVLAWALTWPISKIGIQLIPAIWLTAAKIDLAAFMVVLISLFSGKMIIPSRRDLPMILIIGIFFFGIFQILINVGLSFTKASQAAVLVYTQSIWVTPIAVIFFKETLSLKRLIALLLGMGGIVLIFHPWDYAWHDKKLLYGDFLLILSAWIWSGIILYTRYGKWYRKSSELLPWQFILSAILVTSFAFLKQPHFVIAWSWQFVILLLFIGCISMGLANWCYLNISNQLPAITISIFLLGIPMLGLLFSNLILHETISIYLIIAAILIFLSMFLS